jgi:hypothetical protein
VVFAAIDAPGGFLFEWWSVFWDIFIARTNEKHSEVAASYIEVKTLICHLGSLTMMSNGFAIVCLPHLPSTEQHILDVFLAVMTSLCDVMLRHNS